MLPGLKEAPWLACTDEFTGAFDLIAESWPSTLVNLAHDALFITMGMQGNMEDHDLTNVVIREFVRAAFDHGGLADVHAVVDGLAQLVDAEGGRP